MFPTPAGEPKREKHPSLDLAQEGRLRPGGRQKKHVGQSGAQRLSGRLVCPRSHGKQQRGVLRPGWGCRALQGWPWASCSVYSFSSEMKSFLSLCCFMEHVLHVGRVPALTELASSWDCQQVPRPRVMELQWDRWAGSQHLLGPLLRFPVGGGKTVMVGGKGAEHTQQIPRSPLGKTSSSHQCNPHHHSSPIPPVPTTVGPRRPRPCSALTLGTGHRGPGSTALEIYRRDCTNLSFWKRAPELKGAIHEVCPWVLCAQRVGIRACRVCAVEGSLRVRGHGHSEAAEEPDKGSPAGDS